MNFIRSLLGTTGSRSKNHFIVIDRHRLMYARVPKVANTSIKEALSRLLPSNHNPGLRKTQDKFWKRSSTGESRMVCKTEAEKLNATYFSFSFVRNPFDRVISCYHNKIIANSKISPAMVRMGMRQGMPFDEFVQALAVVENQNMDVHLMPQSAILATGDKVIPKFVGRFESLAQDWNTLGHEFKQRGLPSLGKLPARNVRREKPENLLNYFPTAELIHIIHSKYQKDMELFYAGISTYELIDGSYPRDLPPLNFTNQP